MGEAKHMSEDNQVQKLRDELFADFRSYWESPTPWDDISSNKGLYNLKALKDKYLLRLSDSKYRKFLFSLSNDSDVYYVFWAERLLCLYYETGEVDNVFKKKYVWNIFYSIKSILKMRRGRQINDSISMSWTKALKKLIARFENVVLSFADPALQKKWHPYVVHYKVNECNDDSDLDQLFLTYRAEYNKNFSSRDNLVRYAWVVVDCINRAIKLLNKKLVEVFAAEGKELQERLNNGNRFFVENEKNINQDLIVDESPNMGKDISINNQLHYALIKADNFLSGEGEASSWLMIGEVEKAISTYKELLDENPNNQKGKINLIRLYFHIGDIVNAEKLLEDNIITEELIIKLAREVVSSYYDVKKSCGKKFYELKRRFSLQAKFYLGCVNKYGKNIKLLALEKFNVVESLYLCALAMQSDSLANEFSVVLDIFKYLVDINYKWEGKHKTTNSAYGHLLLKAGLLEDARQYLKEDVINNLNSVYAWVSYGKSFEKTSIDAAKCFCRAILCSEANEFLKILAHDLLGNFFEETQQLSRAAREYAIADEIRKKYKLNLKYELRMIASKFLGLSILPNPIDSNDDVYRTLSSSASDLISCDTVKVCGVIVGIQAKRLRVWYEGVDGVVPSGFAYVLANSSEKVIVGMPIYVLINHCVKSTAISWSKRESGILWDIYPKTIGVVTKVDYNRRFWSITIDDNIEISVGEDCIPSVSKVPVGSFVNVCVVNSAGVSQILDVSINDSLTTLPPFVEKINGVLIKEKQSRFGKIGNTFVPERLCREIPSGTQMEVLAVKVTDHKKKKISRLAFTLA